MNYSKNAETNQILPSDGKILLKAARESIEGFLKTARIAAPPEFLSVGRFQQKMGCFVTLKTPSEKEDSLRGCIGFPEPVYKLTESLPMAAVYAATEDPRFPPVEADELDKLRIEVSVLTKPVKIEVAKQTELPEKINVGIDGLIMKWTHGSGLLLPQVAVEYDWNAVEFLENLSLKAGAPSHQWLVEGTSVSKFQALVFQETKPRGDVIFANSEKPKREG